MAVVGRPELVFLDEPTAGLDPQARRATWELVEALRHDGVTVVLTTHFMDEAERLADQVVVVDHGRVVAVGSPGELTAARRRRQPAVRRAARAGRRGACGGAARRPAGSTRWLRGATSCTATSTPTCWPTVTRWCADREVMPEGLTVGRRTLEDVFLDLTGTELRA